MTRGSNTPRRLGERLRRMERETRARADRAQRQARELADDAVVFGLGAPAYALDKVGNAAREAIDAPSRARKPARQKRSAATGDARSYEERTKEELYELAQERDVEGRSRMTKKQLIRALRRSA